MMATITLTGKSLSFLLQLVDGNVYETIHHTVSFPWPCFDFSKSSLTNMRLTLYSNSGSVNIIWKVRIILTTPLGTQLACIHLPCIKFEKHHVQHRRSIS